MNTLKILGILLCLCLGVQARDRQRIPFDEGWRFLLGEAAQAEKPGFNDRSWRVLDLPHDWSVEGAFDQQAPTGGQGGYLPTGIGWYRKTFTLPATARGKRVRIEFDGVYMNSEVWVNGVSMGTYPYGYSSFHYDITPYLKPGQNVVAVRVDNAQQPNSRWYSGSGIYRHVWLTITNQLQVGHWGVQVSTLRAAADSALLQIRTRVENRADQHKKFVLRTVLQDASGRQVASVEAPASVVALGEQTLTQTLRVLKPALWSVETPHMYTVVSVLTEQTGATAGKTVDEVSSPVGIREIVYDLNKGFLLNGKQVKMNGVCLHHDGGPVGAAVPEKVWERRLRILKAMGCNAIRTSHNPVAPEFLDLCDRLGFLVQNEVFDEWQVGKNPHSYFKYFDQWHEQDVVSFIRRDFNHPSVVLYSAGNEIREQSRTFGPAVLKQLMDIFHREDPTRPVTTGNDQIAADGGRASIEFLNLLDIVGYNYVDRWHERRELYYGVDRYDHPAWKMIGTENVSVGGVRGSYSLGNDPQVPRASYLTNMIRAEQLWKFTSSHDYVIGDFMWTGIDYLGEARWPTKNSSSGVIDLCGYPKDGYYFYQSQWTDSSMVYLFPHWNWKGREGQIIPVVCYSNCDAVELFLNGKSYGEKRMEFPRQGNSGGWNRYDRPQINPTTADLHLTWDVPYEPGTLRAVGKKAGKEVVVYEVHTAGAPAAIRARADATTLVADGRDVVHIEVDVVDAKGHLVPDASDLVRFELSGPARIIGVENGNPSDHDPVKANQKKAFNGKCLAIVQTEKGKSGEIRLVVSSGSLTSATLQIRSSAPGNGK